MNKELYELSYSLKKEMRQRVLSIVCMLVAVYIVINLILAFVVFPVRQVSVSMESDVGRNSCMKSEFWLLFCPWDAMIKYIDMPS